ncbi:hypothetical protein CHARACLAT_018517 [Characodon lateralis]|uniref:Uncharacterized protein n=1 Tax=Characodon lateralis TaxID=208331 RepID=A0ABU7DI89_9TELE|nr:hypothetical protein [Characodon lateralis]
MTVKDLSPTRRRRIATLSSTGVNPNTPPPLLVGHSRVEESSAPLEEMRSRAHAVHGGEPDYTQSISLDLPHKLRLLPPSEVTFHVPRASLSIRGSGRRGLHLRPPPNPLCTGPSWFPLQVVGPLGDGLTSLVWAWPGRVLRGAAQPPGTLQRVPTPVLAPGWTPAPLYQATFYGAVLVVLCLLCVAPVGWVLAGLNSVVFLWNRDFCRVLLDLRNLLHLGQTQTSVGVSEEQDQGNTADQTPTPTSLEVTLQNMVFIFFLKRIMINSDVVIYIKAL